MNTRNNYRGNDRREDPQTTFRAKLIKSRKPGSPVEMLVFDVRLWLLKMTFIVPLPACLYGEDVKLPPTKCPEDESIGYVKWSLLSPDRDSDEDFDEE